MALELPADLSLQGKKLGILLSTPPENANAHTVTRLSEEALAAGVDVYLYLIDEGVKNLNNPPLVNLASSGAKFFVCAYGCQQHKVPTEGYPKEVTFCGLVVLSNIITGCDRFLAFN
ncbi:DsrE family protein [Nitrospira sp. M1]